MTEQEQRDAIINESLTWERTPHHNGARIKGAGIDCGQFPLAVYSACGLIPEITVPRYSAQFHLHCKPTEEDPKEWYLDIADKYGKRIKIPQRGDFALYKIGRIYSHGAIVMKWPRIIHAWVNVGVTQDIGDQGHLFGRDVIFFTPFKDL